jgi:hypothetical protein
VFCHHVQLVLLLLQIQDGQLDDASQQLEFLSVLQDSAGPSPEVAFLKALLAGTVYVHHHHIMSWHVLPAQHSIAVNVVNSSANTLYDLQLLRLLLCSTLTALVSCSSVGFV